MQSQTRTILALCGITATIAVAVALAFVSGGRAASTNICIVPSTGTPLSAASCVKELVAPHFITAGNDAVALTKFTNESTGATATHVVVSVSFSSSVTVKSIGLTVGGTAADTSGCSPVPSSLPTSATSVSCPVGTITAGVKVILTVRFSASTATNLTGAAAYGEGPGNPSNPPNDFQVNYDTLNISGTAAGGCFNTPPANGVTGSGTQNSNKQTTTAIISAAPGSLPCTFVDAGVDFNKRPGGTTFVSFIEFPVMPTPATVKLIFQPLPSSLKNNFPLNEDTGNGIVIVPDCNGATVPPAGFDSCIVNRTTLPKGGLEIDMLVTGSPFDGGYWG
jgi:hypothetical protein